jgi:hypothetical protein
VAELEEVPPVFPVLRVAVPARTPPAAPARAVCAWACAVNASRAGTSMARKTWDFEKG